MDPHRVLLICRLPLLCEGVQRIVESMDDLQLVALDCSDPEAILTCLRDFAPGTVLIAGDGVTSDARLISDLLSQWPDTSVIWIEMAANILHVYTSHTLPASSQQLISAIRHAGQDGDRSPARAKPHRRR